MLRIKAGEYVATRIRPGRKLDEERGQQVAASLLIGVFKVEIKIGHGGSSRLAQTHHILYDRGAAQPFKFH
jgi:hypothetical protein